MSNIIIPRSFNQQPQQTANINGDNPLIQGLVFAGLALPNKMFYDAISGQTCNCPGGSTVIRKPVDGNGAASSQIRGAAAAPTFTFPNRTGLDLLSGPFSLFTECSINVNSVEQWLFRSYEDNNGRGVSLRMDDVNAGLNHFRLEINSSSDGTGCNGALGANSEQFTHRIAATNDGTSSRYYAKRKLQATNSQGASPTADSGRRTYLCGSHTQTTDGMMSVLLGWNRIISLNEYQMLFDNPWQVFGMPQRIWANAAAGGGGGFTAKNRRTIGPRVGSRSYY